MNQSNSVTYGLLPLYCDSRNNGVVVLHLPASSQRTPVQAVLCQHGPLRIELLYQALPGTALMCATFTAHEGANKLPLDEGLSKLLVAGADSQLLYFITLLDGMTPRGHQQFLAEMAVKGGARPQEVYAQEPRVLALKAFLASHNLPF